MGDMARIAWRHKQGSVGPLLNHEGPPALRNHMRQNIRLMRAKERHLKEQRKKEESTATSPFKLKQFENVPSRLHEVPERQRPRSPSKTMPRSSSSPILISFGTRVTTPPHDASPESSVRSTPVKKSNASRSPLTITPEKSAPPADERGTIDVDEFKRAAEQLRRFQPPRRIPAKDAEGRPTRLSQSGPVEERAEEADKENVTVPPGYRLMPETERVETLEVLRQKLIDLDRSYARLPLKIETEGKKQQQQALREKIAETEDAVKLFSRPRVLIEV
mmetsp:Transcript_41513/g.72939  ORF Transcript_41513/g.72939 Transcript_41513/m.72939 type:complete len:276 (+) Transcript_41513:81-908(+)